MFKTYDRRLLMALFLHKEGRWISDVWRQLKKKIYWFQKVGNSLSPSIDNVQLVDNLKHNLLSISQLCDKIYRIDFDSSSCKIEEATSNRVVFIGSRNKNVHSIDIARDHLDKNIFCHFKRWFLALVSTSWVHKYGFDFLNFY